MTPIVETAAQTELTALRAERARLRQELLAVVPAVHVYTPMPPEEVRKHCAVMRQVCAQIRQQCAQQRM
jgi:hypothetical protein